MGGRSESGFELRRDAGEDGGAAGVFSGMVRLCFCSSLQQRPLQLSFSVVPVSSSQSRGAWCVPNGLKHIPAHLSQTAC